MRRVALAVAVLALAGCGGTAERTQPKPQQPKLPADLASSWASTSDRVAGALAAGDGCSAQRLASELQAEFVAAVNAGRVPRRLQEPLGAAFDDLHGRIACVPTQPADKGDDDGQGRGHGHGHRKHGDQGDQGDQ